MIVAGHSLGGLVALELARRAPARVAGLVLVACGLPMPVNPSLLELVVSDPDAALALILSAATGGRRGAVGPGGEAIAARMRVQMRGADPQRNRAELAAVAAFDPSSWLGDLTVPAIVLAGSEDRMVAPAAAANLAQALGAELRVVEGAGHQLPWEAPGAVLEALRASRRRPAGAG